jgi:hypothetical protein
MVLVMEELDHEEIKKHTKSVLGSAPSDATLDLHPPMRPEDDFIEMVSALHYPPSSLPLSSFSYSLYIA